MLQDHVLLSSFLLFFSPVSLVTAVLFHLQKVQLPGQWSFSTRDSSAWGPTGFSGRLHSPLEFHPDWARTPRLSPARSWTQELTLGWGKTSWGQIAGFSCFKAGHSRTGPSRTHTQKHTHTDADKHRTGPQHLTSTQYQWGSWLPQGLPGALGMARGVEAEVGGERWLDASHLWFLKFPVWRRRGLCLYPGEEVEVGLLVNWTKGQRQWPQSGVLFILAGFFACLEFFFLSFFFLSLFNFFIIFIA